jgi:glycosyltransferase involved in cell wall biosynthesis
VGRITYHYLSIRQWPLFKWLIISSEIHSLVRKLIHQGFSNPWIIADTNTFGLNHIALSVKKKFKLKSIAIVTDNPYLLTQMKKSRAKSMIRMGRKHDGFFTLTPALNDLFNPKKKPSLTIAGLAEKRDSFSKYARPYFFFSGALYSRYGIDALLKAFFEIKADIDLLIAGHGDDEALIQELANKNKKLKFLGTLSQEELYKYQAGAFANINPRPFDEDMDAYALPSKMIEYLGSGSPIISTLNQSLFNLFGDLIYWAGSGSELELKVAMERFIKMKEDDRVTMGKKAQAKALSLFGLDQVSMQFDQLISLIK